MAKANSKSQQERLNSLKKKKNGSKRNNSKPKKSNAQQQTIKNLEDKLKVYENIITELRSETQEQEDSLANLRGQIEELSTSPAEDLVAQIDARAEDLASFQEAPTPQQSTGSEPIDSAQVEQLEAQLTVSKQEAEDWKNKCLRTLADLQNLQKQTELDIQQAKKRAKKATVFSLLEFLNTLNISFSYVPESEDEKVTSFIKTLKGSFEKVIAELQTSGIEILRIEPGQDFDPEYMNILNTQVGEGEVENKVVQVVGLGLRIDDQLVQPASVIIK